MTDYSKAIRALLPSATFTINANDYEQINWISGFDTIPTKQELDEAYLRHREQTDYIEARRPEYPTIADQMDLQYWDAVNGTTTWKDAIDAVKAAHPKPE